jgi:membrane protease YdiL (CAAX protease family)
MTTFMTTFQRSALLLIAIWLGIVGVRFRRSTIVLVGGLFAIAFYTGAALARGTVSADELGLVIPSRPLVMIGLVLVWWALMLAYSPLADRLATRWFAKPPTLQAFRTIQQSTLKLVAGILVAWVLGGILEELAFRGIVLRSVQLWLAAWVGVPNAAACAVLLAASGAGLIHIYQGSRAVAIIVQLSVLLGVLFVISGYNLWAVILCHGLYDTVAFIRFANKKSKYSNLEGDAPSALVNS